MKQSLFENENGTFGNILLPSVVGSQTKYQIIYADPAWSFKTYSEKGKEKKSAENHYKCMTIDDIYNLPINEITDEVYLHAFERTQIPKLRLSYS